MSKQNLQLKQIDAATSPSPQEPARGLKIARNRNGQLLGRKGRDTRERILAAAREMLAAAPDGIITLKSVAARASISMGSIYLYFDDMSELAEALLSPVFETAEERYLSAFRLRWDEEEIGMKCLEFVTGFYEFWRDNSALLALRHKLSDQPDVRMMDHRIASGMQVINLLRKQMEPKEYVPDSDQPDDRTIQSTATILYTGIERTCALHTDGFMAGIYPDYAPDTKGCLAAEARLMSLAIRDCRGQWYRNGRAIMLMPL